MYETEQSEAKELEIPPHDQALISMAVAQFQQQLEHQYRMGIFRGLKLADEQIKQTAGKYGR